MGSVSLNSEPDVSETYDIVSVGAGLSGINTAYRLQTQLPDTKFTVFEGRDDIGGTWDLFKYPGARSDSDLYTFGFPWEPWPHDTPIAEAPLLKSYMRKCMDKYELGKYFQFRHKVLAADWSSKAQRWTVTVKNDDHVKRVVAKFLILGVGYYDYETPLQTQIPGLESFQGTVIHPQFWPQDYDHSGKRIALIGSGATAVTLFPVLARTAKLVTLIQRSPSYIVSLDNKTELGWLTRLLLPRALVATYKRWKNILHQHLFILICQRWPQWARSIIRKDIVKQLPPKLAYDQHFQPRYNPWEQRVCLAPDGDFYQALHGEHAEIRTDIIDTVVPEGIRLKGSGETLPADAIVTATGIRMRFGSTVTVSLDGGPPISKRWFDRYIWNGCMLSEVPNFMFVWGYTNASWTLGSDDTATVLVRIMRQMKKKGQGVARPVDPTDGGTRKIEPVRMWQLSSTYSHIGESVLPKYSTFGPWRSRTNPPLDWVHARFGNLTTDIDFEPAI